MAYLRYYLILVPEILSAKLHKIIVSGQLPLTLEKVSITKPCTKYDLFMKGLDIPLISYCKSIKSNMSNQP